MIFHGRLIFMEIFKQTSFFLVITWAKCRSHFCFFLRMGLEVIEFPGMMDFESSFAISYVEGIVVRQFCTLRQRETWHRCRCKRQSIVVRLECVKDKVRMQGEPSSRPGLTRLCFEVQKTRQNARITRWDLEQTWNWTGRRSRRFSKRLRQCSVTEPAHSHVFIVLEK